MFCFSVLGVLSSFIPLSIAVTLCLYWIVVVKVYLAKVRLASDMADNDNDDPIDTDNEDEEKVAVIRKKNRRKQIEEEKQDQEQTKALMQRGGKHVNNECNIIMRK